MADIRTYIAEDIVIETDPQGYLLDSSQWNEHVAVLLAERDGIDLTDGHWEVLHFLRMHYHEYGRTPNVRLLIKTFARQFGAVKGNREYLYSLFPEGPSRQGCRIAGLPVPQDCIDL